MNRLGDMIVGISALVVFIGFISYVAFRAVRNTEDPGKLIVRWVATIGLLVIGFIYSLKCGPYAPLVMLVFAVPAGLFWAPTIGEIVASPLTTMFDGGRDEVDP